MTYNCDYATLLQHYLASHVPPTSTPPPATVYLVGAGPGDPGLLTLRGRDLLATAEVVLYDYLANPRLLEHAHPQAELHCLGRHGQAQGRGRLIPQDEVHRLMIAAAEQGKSVVRLKGGDPGVFGRLHEETSALEAAGVPYEVVPGVTSAMAASTYSGVPLTHRDHASCVAFVTGRECRDKQGGKLDFASLASFPGTLVFYMGVTTAPEWSQQLIAHGKSATTPVAIVRHASLPQQQLIMTTLGEVRNVLAPGRIRPPAIIIVGETVQARSEAEWFINRPLFGQTVLVTRPEHQAHELVTQLEQLGATVLQQPAIQITPPDDWQSVDQAIANLASYQWLVFSSANGVHFFFERLLLLGHDLRSLAGLRLATIGPATAAALAEYRLTADLQPDEYRAEALADALVEKLVEPKGPTESADPPKLLLLRASRGREVLAETLREHAAIVDQVVVYNSRDVTQPNEEVEAALAAGQIDWVTVTSSAIARSLVAMFGKLLSESKRIAISPITAEVLAQAGQPAEVVAEQYDVPGLTAALVAANASPSAAVR